MGEKPPDPYGRVGNTDAQDVSPAPNQDVREPGGPPGDGGAPAAGKQDESTPRTSLRLGMRRVTAPRRSAGKRIGPFDVLIHVLIKLNLKHLNYTIARVL